MTRSTRRAFTLIELLVVIAIIAILAAILFPVFAQARQAARAASSQSNLRQLSLGILMYVQDYDETFPRDHTWRDSGSPITVGGVPLKIWAWDILPYIKNVDLFQDPMSAIQVQAPTNIFGPFFTSYGYNYTALSPSTGSNFLRAPSALAAVSKPAELVMLGGKGTYTDMGGIWWYGADTLTTLGGIDPPDCYSCPEWCFGGWGVSGNWGAILRTEEAGRLTGANSLRKATNANFALADGHCKFMPAGQGARGTNWNKTLPESQLVINDRSLYMWDANAP